MNDTAVPFRGMHLKQYVLKGLSRRAQLTCLNVSIYYGFNSNKLSLIPLTRFEWENLWFNCASVIEYSSSLFM